MIHYVFDNLLRLSRPVCYIVRSRIFARFTFLSNSNMSTSTSSMSCRLVCLQHSHEGIPLPDGVTVQVGRSPETRIIDPRCSRNQVSLTSNWSQRKVKVQQIGGNPSSVDGTEIGLKKETEVGEEATIFILSGQYPHKVVFTGRDTKEIKEKTEKTKELAKNLKDNNNSKSSVDTKHGKEDEKKSSLKRPSSSKNGVPDAKKKKQDVPPSEGRKSSSEKKEPYAKSLSEEKSAKNGLPEKKKQDVRPSEGRKSSSEKKETCTRGSSEEKSAKKIKRDGEDHSDEETHLKLVVEKLEMMKKNAGKDSAKSILIDSITKRKSSSSDPSSPTPTKVSQASSDSSFSSSSKPSVSKESVWTQHQKLCVYTSKGVESRNKIAGFDVDGTIILTKSGKTFPTDHHDWKIAIPDIFGKLKQLHRDGFKLVFFTNQMGVARGKIKIEDLKIKLENIVTKLQVPVQVFVATHEGRYRKPVDGMWKKLKEQYNGGISIDISQCIYVGDAAGRAANWEPKKKKDFSSSDRLFALNIGMAFKTPEEYFLKRKAAPFTMPVFDPRTLSSTAPVVPSGCKITSDEKELILLVGFPASGKSHFAKHNLKTKGYVIVNRDTLGSWQKCVKVTNESLVNSSVVVDNTNLTLEERKRYVDSAKIAGVPCRCFLMTATFQHCKHNEKYREMTDSSHAKINEIIFNQAKSKFKEPTMAEGFSEIVEVNFVPKFSSQTLAADYKKFILG